MNPQQSIARYRIVLEFGEGRMAAAYRATGAELIAVAQDEETKLQVSVRLDYIVA